MYLVHAVRPKSKKDRWDYRFDFFPKQVVQKKDALELAREAREKGGTAVRVEKVKSERND